MLNQNRLILSIQQPCSNAVPYFMERMQQSGLQVIRTFDLHDTRVEEAACTCPHHGTDACDCQLVVLLVYGKENVPVSLVAHGHNGQTWFSLVEFYGGMNPRLEAQIQMIFSPTQASSQANEALKSK